MVDSIKLLDVTEQNAEEIAAPGRTMSRKIRGQRIIRISRKKSWWCTRLIFLQKFKKIAGS